MNPYVLYLLAEDRLDSRRSPRPGDVPAHLRGDVWARSVAARDARRWAAEQARPVGVQVGWFRRFGRWLTGATGPAQPGTAPVTPVTPARVAPVRLATGPALIGCRP